MEKSTKLTDLLADVNDRARAKMAKEYEKGIRAERANLGLPTLLPGEAATTPEEDAADERLHFAVFMALSDAYDTAWNTLLTLSNRPCPSCLDLLERKSAELVGIAMQYRTWDKPEGSK